MLHIRAMGLNTGGEITGIDVKQLDDKGFAPIYEAWLNTASSWYANKSSKSRISFATAGALA